MNVRPEALKIAMANSCISIENLSKKSKISRFTIQKMLSGKVQTRPATVGKIAAALNVDVIEIIETEQNN